MKSTYLASNNIINSLLDAEVISRQYTDHSYLWHTTFQLMHFPKEAGHIAEIFTDLFIRADRQSF